jgi:hypothetical protein
MSPARTARRVAGLVAAILAWGIAPAGAEAPPYELPVRVPAAASSPSVDPAAPYTPLVRDLIKQLLPDDPPTLPELQNAAKLFQGGTSPRSWSR